MSEHICFICQKPIESSVTRVTLEGMNGLDGVTSVVTLCDDHSGTDRVFLRKRLEDYYE